MSWIFGLLIGATWMGEVIIGNLGGTSVFGNVREFHPRIYSLAPLFALAAVVCTALSGIIAAYRTGRIRAALQVGIWSGLISGAIVGVTLMSITVLFHDAMLQDPSNIH
jgi:hypothetical protein